VVSGRKRPAQPAAEPSATPLAAQANPLVVAATAGLEDRIRGTPVRPEVSVTQGDDMVVKSRLVKAQPDVPPEFGTERK
jgi:hypothetical protein